MFTLGVDFGTNSVRALVVRCSDGAEFGSRVVDYPSGAQGVLLDPKDGHLASQHPGDYLAALSWNDFTGFLTMFDLRTGKVTQQVGTGIGSDKFLGDGTVAADGPLW